MDEVEVEVGWEVLVLLVLVFASRMVLSIGDIMSNSAIDDASPAACPASAPRAGSPARACALGVAEGVGSGVDTVTERGRGGRTLREEAAGAEVEVEVGLNNMSIRSSLC
jgi:hypothetical protein